MDASGGAGSAPPAVQAALAACAAVDWASVTPAVFGAVLQALLGAVDRRRSGVHYTAARDARKLVDALVLDELRAALRSIRRRAAERREALLALLARLGSLRLLDPACGAGDVLLVAYAELTAFERELRAALRAEGVEPPDPAVGPHQLHGIDADPLAVEVARMAIRVTARRGVASLPGAPGAASEANIHHANALRIDWADVLPPARCTHVLGNPPFVGKHLLTRAQAEDMAHVWGDGKGAGVLDLVTAWYRKAAAYIQGTPARVAFVSTNSITQGEQPGVLWDGIRSEHPVHLHFAHRSFPWRSEARGSAQVHVVIIGFGAEVPAERRVWDYDADPEHPTVTTVGNISPYLLDGGDTALRARSKPLCDAPPILYGSKPADDGNLILEADEVDAFLAENPAAAPFVRPMLSAAEFLEGGRRYALWLADAPATVVRGCPGVRARVEAVRRFREASPKAATRALAEKPTVFAEVRQPTEPYIVIPMHTTERRRWIPFGVFGPDTIVHNSCTFIRSADPWVFGVVSSSMHVAWCRVVAGRLGAALRYSNTIVYNNFPWPTEATPEQRAAVVRAAEAVLAARAGQGAVSLADLYDPVAMPAALVDAHRALDRAVERCYRRDAFASDRARLEHLFARHEALVGASGRAGAP